MPRPSGPYLTDRLIGKVLSVILLLLVVTIIPAFALPVVQNMTPTGTPRVIQNPTPAPTTVATVQTVQTVKPQTTVPTNTMVTFSPAKTVTQTYTPVMTGTPVVIKTQGGSTGAVTGTPRATGTVSGPAGTPRIIETPITTGGDTGTLPTFSGTGQQATAGGTGAGASFARDSPKLEAAIAGTFNQSRLHLASLQDVELGNIGTSRTGGGNTDSAGSADRYNADVTATKKGDPTKNCPDDTITISLRNIRPESPVAGEIVTGGSQMMFADPSIRTINIDNGVMKIASVRQVKILGIFDISYSEVSSITPAGISKIDRPFWVGLPGAHPQLSVAGGNPCNEQVMGRQNAGLTPGVTPTPTPEYHANEIEMTCRCVPDCTEGAAARCYQESLGPYPNANESQKLQLYDCCQRESSTFSYNCCYQNCMPSFGDQSQMTEYALGFLNQDCESKCLWAFAMCVVKHNNEVESATISRIMHG